MSKISINWFEIPVADVDRAQVFYSKVFNTELTPMEMPDAKMRTFQSGGNPIGALIQGKGNQPGATGTLLYFDAQGDLDAMLGRVTAAGGKIVVPRTSIGAHGHIAQFVDPDGNRVALHTM